MELTISKDKLEKKLEESLKNYDEKYKELYSVYKTKLSEYVKAVTKAEAEIKTGKIKTFDRSPPSLPTNVRKRIKEALEAVKMHNTPEIKMTDSEFKSMMSGVSTITASVSESVMSLNAVTY